MKRAGMVNEIIRNVADIPDMVARAFYIKQCAELFQLPEETLNAQLRKAVWKKEESGKQKVAASLAGADGKQEEIDIQISTPQSEQINIEEIRPRQSKLDIDNRLEQIEKNIILLILKYGMYEVDVQEFTEDGEPYYTNCRIDQYIFDEFHHQQIHFTNPLFQKIYFEYAEIAKVAENQDVIKSYFSTIEDKEISDFVIFHLLNDDPEFSEQWLSRFDIVTRSMGNNIQKLNSAVEETILMFKLRVIEDYRKLIIKEIEENKDEKLEEKMFQKLQLLLKRREEIAKLLGAVITC